MRAEVVCYSGYKGDERPVRFRLSGQDYFVEELLDQWYGPQEVFFGSSEEIVGRLRLGQFAK